MNPKNAIAAVATGTTWSNHERVMPLPLRLIRPTKSIGSDPDSRYEFWSAIEHNSGRLVVLGLFIETVLVFWVQESWAIKGPALTSDCLIVLGVWGEIWAGNKARMAGDAIVEEARARAAEANRVATETQLERLRLEAKLAPRSMSFDEARNVCAAVKEFSGMRADIQNFGHGFPEVTRACRALANVLHNAGWGMNVVPPPDPVGSIEGIFVGIESGADEPTRRAKEELIKALNAIGWEAGEYRLPLPLPSIPNALIDVRYLAPLRIMVGFKPDPISPSDAAETSTQRNAADGRNESDPPEGVRTKG